MRTIQLYDTTLRDGSQAEGVSFSLQDKILFAQKLDSLGFDYIEGGFPGSNEKDAQFFQHVYANPLTSAKVCAFGMTRRKGLKPDKDDGILSLVDSRSEIITVVGKSSAFQVAEVLNAKLDENLAMIAETVKFFRKHNRRVFFDAEHFFDGWKDEPDYSLQVLKTATEAGAEMLSLCDTNGGSMPDLIAAGVRAALSLPTAVGIHTHNDCGLAVANSLAAVDAGASLVQGTINGVGERCGNADLITIAANLALKRKGEFSVLKHGAIAGLTELSRYVYEMLNWQIPNNSPFVGKSAFAHKGGMHVSGIARNTASYEHIAPESIGNQRRILISELAGRSNIAAKTKRLNLQLGSETIEKILAEVVCKENKGYQYETADGSFGLIVRKCTDTYREHFKRIGYHVYVQADEDGVLVTVANVKLQINGEVRYEVAEGDGPVSALNAAMRKALEPLYPALAEMHLVDFKVRVVNSEAATEAAVRVVIDSADKDGTWGTIGASENVIEASWIALADSIEYKLNKDI
ncbi:MAG: citramalate synthase [Planctomycetaceae bacterium]|jgi:2-isopropylmalate synthase|nr:citramalate synthase [Planctomycetaceae bacterium]